MSSRKIEVIALTVLAGLLLVASSDVWAILCQANADCNTKVDLSDLVIMKQDFNKTGCDACMCNPNSECPTGMVECAGECVDSLTDEANCGGCDIPCSGTCVAGVCQQGGEVCNGTLSALGRWCDQNNGTVKDMTTGLVWLKDAGCKGSMDWYNAIQQPIINLRNGDCSGTLTDGSVWGDWRLPTETELVGITVGTEHIHSYQIYFFANVRSGYYWSSTTHAGNPVYAWYVDVFYGYLNYYGKSNGYHVWPVRGGQ